MIDRDLDRLRERYTRWFGEEPAEPLACERIERTLEVVLPRDLKTIARFYSGGLLGGISHHAISDSGPATNVGQETARLRRAVNLPSAFIVLAEPAESLVVLQTQAGEDVPTPVIWCSAFDVARLDDVAKLTAPQVWSSYAEFFAHLLDEEADERSDA